MATDEAARYSGHRVYEMIVGDSEDNETHVSIARALRRRFEDAVPISQNDHLKAQENEPEVMIEESTGSPKLTLEESERSMEIPEQEAVTEMTRKMSSICQKLKTLCFKPSGRCRQRGTRKIRSYKKWYNRRHHSHLYMSLRSQITPLRVE